MSPSDSPMLGSPVQPPPRDLADFILRWNEFSAPAHALARSACIDAHTGMILRWLIQLADRVGPQDLAPSDPPRAGGGPNAG